MILRRKRQREDLEQLSDRELDRLYWDEERKKTEPRLREEERKLGTEGWETLSYSDLLRRSIARYDETCRPRYLRQARRLGIKDAERLSTEKLKWRVFEAEMRERRIKELSR